MKILGMNHKIVAILFFLVGGLAHSTPMLIVVRHGHSDHNARGDLMNSNPRHLNYFISNLTGQGKTQVQESAAKLSKHPITSEMIAAVYASPLPRTIQTAEIFSEAGLFDRQAIKTDERLIEVDMGNAEGMPFEIFSKTYPQRSEQAEAYQGESAAAVQKRVENFFNEIFSIADGKYVVIFTHGFITEAIAQLFGGSGMQGTAEYRIYDLNQWRRSTL